MFCHFRISVAGSPPRTVVFQLHPEKCPKTCDNFVALCQSPATAKRPSSASSARDDAQPTYRGTEFHRILPGFMIQGGDFSNFDGTGGRAAPTTNEGRPTFQDENFDISHDQEGILSMANRGRNTNGSQFFITLGKTLHLDGKHVAFGRVVRGMDVVREASRVETEGSNGKPVLLQRVAIVDCGLGTGDDDGDDSSSSSSSSSGGSSSESLSSDGRRKRSRSKRSRRRREDEDDASRKKRKRSCDGSSRSKHHKQRGKNDGRHHKQRKSRRDKSSHRRRSRDHSSLWEEDDRHSSKKRRKRDRRGDERRRRKR